MRKIFKSPTGIIGVILLTIVLFATVFGPWIAPYDPQAFDARARLQGPSLAHWLGTDQYGRDLLSRILSGAPSTVWRSLSPVPRIRRPKPAARTRT